jgi:hypothetical protein
MPTATSGSPAARPSEPPPTVRRCDTLPSPAPHGAPPRVLRRDCASCGADCDPGLLMLVSLGGTRPVACSCGARLYHPAPEPRMPRLAARYRARPVRRAA